MKGGGQARHSDLVYKRTTQKCVPEVAHETTAAALYGVECEELDVSCSKLVPQV